MSEIDKVIEHGYCIGCGACALGQSDSSYQVGLDPLGFYRAQATRPSQEVEGLDSICPFTNSGPHEDQIASNLFAGLEWQQTKYLGSYLTLYAGHVVQNGFRVRGSSGGFTSWILAELLTRGLVDAVIHVKPSSGGEVLYEYGISRDLEALNSGAKSHYYPVEMSGVLRHIRENPGRYAVVGVPCFVKALRRLMESEAVFNERIAYCVGLFCGHLKSKGFAEMLAAQCGVRPKQLSAIDFRTKLEGQKSYNYGITAFGVDHGEKFNKTRAVSELVGTDWGMGFFKYKACDFCDDLSAETADVSVGDAWLPQYSNDSMGTNVVIVRRPEIRSLIEEGIKSGALSFEPLSLEDVIKSQSANVRHRREDLPYRLKKADDEGQWRPLKREDAGDICDAKRQSIQDQRMYLRDNVPQVWAEAVERDGCNYFFKKIKPWVRSYNKLYGRHCSFPRKIYRKLRAYLKDGWKS